MDKKKGEKVKDLLSFDTFRALRFRARAFKALKTGEIDELRRKRASEGACPWKIISYKRVLEPSSYPFPLLSDVYVKTSTFEKHMHYLARECKVLKLKDLTARLSDYQEVPEKAVAVVFFGGHMSTYLDAFPILSKYQIPATVFLATGYIDSGSFFYDDRLVMCLMMLQDAKANMLDFDYLDPILYRELEQVSPDGSINLEVITKFVLHMHGESQKNRVQVMQDLAEIITNFGDLPEFKDFLGWEEVRHLQKMGIDFASMGHFCAANPSIESGQFVEDLQLSFSVLKEQGVEALNLFSFPDAVMSPEKLQALSSLSVPYIVNPGTYPEPRFQESMPMLLGCIPMFEAASYSTDVFACRLWELEIGGVQY